MKLSDGNTRETVINFASSKTVVEEVQVTIGGETVVKEGVFYSSLKFRFFIMITSVNLYDFFESVFR